MPNTHAILSEIYHLLSAYDREDFLRASRYPRLGHPIRDALLALASEPRAKTLNPDPSARTRTPKRRLERRNLELLAQDDKVALANSIIASENGDSINSLRSFATMQGLKLEPHVKESKAKLARRLASAILNLPETKRSRAMADLTGKVSAQTQGWIDVIKGKKS